MLNYKNAYCPKRIKSVRVFFDALLTWRENKSMLQITGLCKSYKRFSLKNINLSVKKGDIMGFIGPNGAGKSTTIKSILTIHPFDKGQILINNMDNVKNEQAVKQIIGYIGEQSNLYTDVSALNIYKFVKKFYFKWDDTVFNKLIKQFNLDLSKKIKELSKGTCMKFLLALALSHHPELLILDEPTSGLDPVVRDELLNILLDISHKEGSTIFFSSHITEDIVKIANNVTYINNGEILLIDSKNNVLQNYKKIEFATKVPDSLIKHFKFYKNNTAIVDNLPNFMANCPQDLKNDSKISSAALDDILLFVIRENSAVC